MARWSKSLDPRPLRSEIIELRAAGPLVLPQTFRNGHPLSDRAKQSPTRQAETQGSCETSKAVAHASAEIDR
jgi:hypothetical protein